MGKNNLNKKIVCLCVLATFLVFSSQVFASSYSSTLSLGNGNYVSGKIREYTAGYNNISLKVKSFNKINGLNYTKLNISLVEVTSNYCFEIGSVDKKIDAKTTYDVEWGYLGDGKRYYDFSTKINGITYGGVKSNKVVMSSGKY